MASYYRQLEVWKRAYELNKALHIALKKFPKEEQEIQNLISEVIKMLYGIIKK